MGVTEPLRAEHRELLPHVESLRLAAEAVDGEPGLLAEKLDEALAFLCGHLIPHATAEDAALYPVVEHVMGAPGATATMHRDHVEVGLLTDELAGLRAAVTGARLGPEQARELRRVLYGLYALVRVHFAKEEEVYLPRLDAGLSAQDAERMFERMEQAAQQARAPSGSPTR